MELDNELQGVMQRIYEIGMENQIKAFAHRMINEFEENKQITYKTEKTKTSNEGS